MWNNLSRVLAVALMAVAGLIAYLYFDYQKLEKQLEEAEVRKNELESDLKIAHGQAAELNKRLEQEIAKLSKEKEAELERLKGTHDEMMKSLQKEIQDGNITITRIADRLSVKIVDKILFPSGEATVSTEGEKVLERVGKVLEQAKEAAGGPSMARGPRLSPIADKTIRVEGHTDNVPIGKQLQARFATNWELSTARATTVARFLKEHTEIDPAAFEAVGLSEYHPVADNRTHKGRSLNRRIEIVLYPRVQAVVKELPRPVPAKTESSPKK
jgi:chemotaxis protein MotB